MNEIYVLVTMQNICLSVRHCIDMPMLASKDGNGQFIDKFFKSEQEAKEFITEHNLYNVTILKLKNEL